MQEAKRRLGVHARHHLVAYGLLRGVTYGRIERCSPDNQLDVGRLRALLNEHSDAPPSTRTATVEALLVDVMAMVRPQQAHGRPQEKGS